jgi:predicted secreted protein
VSNAVSGVGTLFRRWNGSEWENIAEVNSITNTKSRETIDVTSLDSTGGYRQFIASFRDAGTAALGMNFTRATYELMNDDFEDSNLQNYEIVLSDPESTSVEFEGLVTELGLGITTDDKITSDVTIKMSGQPVINSGGSSGLT